jgi:tripartite-type tricarboxylate transporter receptor subunit TctC
VARVVADRVSRSFGQTIVIENVVGGGGGIGARRVATADRNGYVIGAFNNGVAAILPHMFTNLGFDPLKDVEPVTLLAGFPSVLIVNKDLPVKNLQDLIAYAKKEPGKLNYASVGVGSPQHLAMEQLAAEAGIKMTHVPYRGGAQATQAISVGEANVFWIALSVAKPFIEAGTVRAIAVGERKRVAALPNVQTVREGGLPDYEYSPWLGLYVTAGTPKPVVERLHKEFTAALSDPEVRDRIAKSGLEPRTSTGAELLALSLAENKLMAKLVPQLNLAKP